MLNMSEEARHPTADEWNFAENHTEDHANNDESPGSPRVPESECSQAVVTMCDETQSMASSFMLVHGFNVVFSLPDGSTHDTLFPTVPSYGALFKEAQTKIQGKQIQLLLDGEPLTNKNTAPQLLEIVNSFENNSVKLIPSMQVAVEVITRSRSSSDQGVAQQQQSVVTARTDSQSQDETEVGWTKSALKIAGIGITIVTSLFGLMQMKANRKLQHENAILEQSIGEKDDEHRKLSRSAGKAVKRNQDLERENAALIANTQAIAKRNEILEKQKSKAAKQNEVLETENSRLAANSRAMAERSEILEKENDTKDMYINQLVKSSRIAALGQHIKRRQHVDLLFMVDCTSSMFPHIEGVKNQIHGIVRRVHAAYPQLCLNLGFLGYRDLCDKDLQFEKFEFSEDVDKFQEFVAGIQAMGGDDPPEDIAGATKQALGWAWQRPVKVLFHIADSPCHGRKYHDMQIDHFPSGTDVPILEQLHILRKLGINYYFGRVTRYTDKMVCTLNEELGPNSDGHLYITSVSIDDPIQIEVAVAQSVLTSVSLVETAGNSPTKDSNELILISQDQPEWHLLEAGVKKHGSMRNANPPASLESLSCYPKSWVAVDVEFVVAPQPFDQGEHRLCYWGVYRVPGQDSWMRVVFKKFKREPSCSRKAKLECYLDEVRKSSIANFFATTFNDSNKYPHTLRFLDTGLIENLDDGTCYLVEAVLPRHSRDHMKKFNDNKGVWDPMLYEEFLGAFTKWTYEYSQHEYMIVDLQGVKKGDSFVLTDPAILHVNVNRFGGTNTGKFFMEETLKNIPSISAPYSRL